MKLKIPFFAGSVAAFAMLSACSDSVPSCGDALVQKTLKDQAQSKYRNQAAAEKKQWEADLSLAESDEKYAKEVIAKGTLYVLRTYGSQALVQFNTDIAHAKLLRAYPPDLSRFDDLIQYLNNKESAFERITTLDTNQSTGAHHCSAQFVFVSESARVISGTVTYTVRNTDDGETYVAASFPKM